MNRQALFAKKEAVYGTPIALSAADVIHAENVRYVLKGEVVKGDGTTRCPFSKVVPPSPWAAWR